jgi:hypothetical protein
MRVRTDKNFKLSKSAKRVMATMPNAEKRNDYKNLMIDAEVAFAKAKLAKPPKTKGAE